VKPVTAMGQHLNKMAGSAYLDATPSPTASEAHAADEKAPEKQRLSIEGVNCMICQETPSEHHICCVNGHGGCVGCFTREKLRTARCPMCRLPMLNRLIPNLALNEAIAVTENNVFVSRFAPPSSPTPPAPPSRRRLRDPEAERTAKLRRVLQVTAAAAALQADILGVQGET
jgi:hypothetical protein